MPDNLVFTVRFLRPFNHARGETGAPEWPPSPLRLLQSLTAAAAGYWNERIRLEHGAVALRWLEALPPPAIVAAQGVPSEVPTQFYVPDNTAELLVPGWKKGAVDATPKRTEKVVCPTNLIGDDPSIHYIYALPEGALPHFETLRAVARSITHLGWGIDIAVGDAEIMDAAQTAMLSGQRWEPSLTSRVASGVQLRVARPGTLDDLARKHTDFLSRVTPDGFRPVPPLRVFDIVPYRRKGDSLTRPYVVFRLLQESGDTYGFPPARLIEVAGMVRHLAINAMTKHPPRGVERQGEWVNRYVAGHRDPADAAVDFPHRQLSFVPLPSIGNPHVDPGVRRVMIVGPIGDEAILAHLAHHLDTLQLKPEKPGDLRGPVFLEHARRDNIAGLYTRPSQTWTSFTPVILPGHDDHKPQKTEKLILKALQQSGIDQPCEFEWSAFSRFSKSYSAHKYTRDSVDKEKKHPAGYIRPDHLMNQTAVHLTVRFQQPVPGPLTIGAGRHCGFGLMAAVDDS